MKTDQTKDPGTFRYVSTGDWHLGHHLTPTHVILANLYHHLANRQRLAPLDAVFITGDVYDRLLSQNDGQVHEINAFITHFLYLCESLDVTVIIVEGTPSHDWQQSRFFVEQARNAKIAVELIYATQLTIVDIPKHDISILMVPDKWRPHPDETLQEVRTLLRQRDVEQVDFAIMHGAFGHQLPAIVPEPTHDAEAYQALVRHQILIGHVHIQSTQGRILAAGSFDRLIHNEEGPKGFFEVMVRDVNDWQSVFHENTTAKRYVTVDCRDLSTEEVNVTLRKVVKDLPKNSAIRIWSYQGDPASGDLKSYAQHYPQFEWSSKKEKNEQQKASVLNEVLETHRLKELVEITPTTVEDLVEKEMTRMGITEEQRQRCRALLHDTVTL